MNIAYWLMRTASAAPSQPALFHGPDQRADYAAFARRAAGLGAWLAQAGVMPGDRVAIWAQNHPDYLTALFGIWCAGAAAVPVNAKLTAHEAAFILKDSGAKVVFTSGTAVPDGVQAIPLAGAAFGKAVATPPMSAPLARAPGDLAWLFYTSGTTGQPKGVMITHRMLMAMSLAYPVDVDAVSPEDATIYAAPMSHGAGLYALIHVLMGARHVVPVSGGFDPGEVLSLAAHHTRAHLFAAPTMVRRLTKHALAEGAKGDGLRTIVYGGGPMYEADIEEAVQVFGPVFVQIYGQGEAPMAITALPRADVADRNHPRWRERLGSVGRAQSVVELRIGDEEGREMPPGEPGEIMVRGDLVMPGYWRNPEASKAALQGGWLRTGDVGVLDADGYLILRDRSKDVIISGGSNVYPREVEDVLLTHPGIEEAAVLGRAHPDWGEEVVAFVVGAATEDELDRLCIERIARFKRPKAYVFVESLPKNNYGKVLKTDLRARLTNPDAR